MIQTIIGKKVDQTQKFLVDGTRIPATLISVMPNSVVQVKTQEKDNYDSLQLGFGEKKNPTKPESGHSKKAGLKNTPVFLHEVRIQKTDGDEIPQSGSFISVASVLKVGDIVSITGTTKGKGFAGVVKRHGFGGGPKTHGQSDRHRAPGAIGQGTTPGRVYKGKRMAGHMGVENATVTGLVVVAVDEEAHTILVKGLVPGNKEGVLVITKTGEKKKVLELLEEKAKREAREAEESKKAEEEAQKAQPEQQVTEEPMVEETKAEGGKQSSESLKEETKTEEVKEETRE